MLKLPHPRKLALFAVLSAADLALTGYLLGLRGGAYESNPVAAWWLVRFGWAGLAGFKLATVTVAAGLAVAVARRRPRAAGGVLTFGCTALAAVVLYSALLVPKVRAQEEPAAGTFEFEPDQQSCVLVRSADEKLRLAGEVADGRLDLLEAAARFRALDATAAVRREAFRLVYPGRTDDERYCRQVLQFVETVLAERGATSPYALESLRAELQARLDRGPLVLPEASGERPPSSPRPFRVAPAIVD